MTSRPPRVSVVIPYYKSDWSIDRTLRSVFAQRWRDMEVILVDDGSPDDVTRHVTPYSDKVRIVRQANKGLAGARNRGIAESIGEFVAPIDADDLWHPAYLETMVKALDEAPSAPFAYSASHRIDEADMFLPPLDLAGTPRHDFRGLISLNSVGSGSAAVLRRRALVAQGGYDETLRARAAQGAEDWKLLVRLAALGKPVYVPAKLVAYRLTRDGMSQARPDRQLASIEAVIQDLRRDFPEAGASIFRDARTMMTAWLLPAFLRRRMFRSVVREGARAYLLNPLWWRNANLRLVHAARLRMALGGLTGRKAPSIRLADLQENGDRPFAFLDDSGTAAG